MLVFSRSSRLKSTTCQCRILTAARDHLKIPAHGGILIWVTVVRPFQSIGEYSLSRSARDGGDDEHNCVDRGFDEDDDNAPLNMETFINTLSASNQPILKQLSVFLEDKEDRISVQEPGGSREAPTHAATHAQLQGKR